MLGKPAMACGHLPFSTQTFGAVAGDQAYTDRVPIYTVKVPAGEENVDDGQERAYDQASS